MQYTFGSKGRSQFFAVLLLALVGGICALFIRETIDSSEFKKSGSVDISGTWDFHNGPLSKKETENYRTTVVVPNPLPDSFSKILMHEFWYRTTFQVKPSAIAEPKALSLGSIKGEHEVYWNGKFLGAGGKTGLAFFRVPSEFLKDKKVTLTVRVKRSQALFPGIVHMQPILFGNSSLLERQLDFYYFDTGVKPLLPAAFKLALFFLFLGFFAAVPSKREFLPFALFAVFSALSSAFYSRFLPGYDDPYFKNGMIFFFFVLALGAIPALTADFLRLPEKERSRFRIYGASLCIVFLSAALLAGDSAKKLQVFRISNEWLPLLALIPSMVMSAVALRKLDSSLLHRKIQIGAFCLFLLAGLFSWGTGVTSFLRYQLFQVYEFLDLVVFAGLGAAIALDFRQTAARSQKAARVVPKWFSGFLSSGLDRVALEIPMFALAVDTVGYTKQLSSLCKADQDIYHRILREKLAMLSDQLGAQKISERGDGGIFAWDFPTNILQRENAMRQVLAAARALTRVDETQYSIVFRVGISAGVVRGEMRGGDISFLGEALNKAARLETLAKPGSALVDESVVSELSGVQLEKEWVEAELKGVLYRAKPLLLEVA